MLDLGTMEEGLVSLDLPSFRVMVHQGKKKGRGSDVPIITSVYCSSLCGQCYDLGLLQLVKSRSGLLPEDTE